MRVFEALHRVNDDASFWLDRDFTNPDEPLGEDLLNALYFFRNLVKVGRTGLPNANQYVELQIVPNPIFFCCGSRIGSREPFRSGSISWSRDCTSDPTR